MSEHYTTIKLPSEFIEMVDDILNIKKLGFSSRTEVVKTAVREYYDKKKAEFPNPEGLHSK
jgi:metal-responsive CopG/Arc/MetJ family transcriptional regulator